MGIFAIITDLEIIDPPVWYTEFTEKYLSRPKPHITLIQPRYVNSEVGKEILEKLKSHFKYCSSMFPITETAHGFVPFRERTGFMIDIPNPQIIEFQRKLRETIPAGLELVNPMGKESEQNFRPHLTMADLVPEGGLPDLMEKYDLENLTFQVRIHKILCTLPPDFSVEESLKESNYHVMLPANRDSYL